MWVAGHRGIAIVVGWSEMELIVVEGGGCYALWVGKDRVLY